MRRILEEAREEKGCAIFETFGEDGPRWDKHQRRLNAPWRENSSASSSERQWQEGPEQQSVGWSSFEKRVMEAENYMENCVHTKVDIEVLERLMEPDNEDVSCSFLTQKRKKDHFVASRRRWLEKSGQEGNKAGKLAKCVA